MATVPTDPQTLLLAFAAGLGVGVLGGLVGLGGAEFRLPLLIGLFGFAALQSVIINKAMSLVVVLVAIPTRLAAVPLGQVVDHLPLVANLLAGSLLGAWVGASWATRVRGEVLHRVLAALLLGIAAVFAADHVGNLEHLQAGGALLVVLGLVAGFVIGVVAAVMGVAGGELLIPTIVVLYGLDVKLAGSLSLLVSLPTMLVAFFRYSRDQAFAVLGAQRTFVVSMAAGSVAGALVGALLLTTVTDAALVPLVVVLLVFSAYKVWVHATAAPAPDPERMTAG